MDVTRYLPVGPVLVLTVGAVTVALVAGALTGRSRGSEVVTVVAARILLAGAVVAVLGATLTSNGGGGVNLVPGAGIRSALGNINRELGLVNVIGNVVLFVPVGFLLPLSTPSRVRRATPGCAALSLGLELTQLAIGRSFDVDDVLLNTAGGFLGAVLGVAALHVWGRWQRPARR